MTAIRDVGHGPRRTAAPPSPRRGRDSRPGPGARALDAKVRQICDMADGITTKLDAIGQRAERLRERAEDRAFAAGAAQMADRAAFDAGWNDSVQRQRAKTAEIQANANRFYGREGK